MIAPKSASNTAVTCGAARIDWAICSAICLRMESCGTRVTPTPGATPAGFARRSISARMSARVILSPLRGTSFTSSPCSMRSSRIPGGRRDSSDGTAESATTAEAVTIFSATFSASAARSFAISPKTVPGSTSTPESTRISDKMPSAGAAISTATLSVSNSTIGSLVRTESPTCLSHILTTAVVPSCSSGTMICVAI